MSSKGFNDLAYTEKTQQIRIAKTPEDLTDMYNEWVKDSCYESVRVITKTLLRICYLNIIISYQKSK